MTEQNPNIKGILLKDLAEKVGGRIEGNPELRIHGIAGIIEAGEADITFVSNPRYSNALRNTKAAAAIAMKPVKDLQLTWLIVNDPYYAFCQTVIYFHSRPHQPLGINPLASIGKNVKMGNASIEDIINIAKIKHDNMLEKDLKAAVKSILGTSASIGILVENKDKKEFTIYN